MTAAKAKGYIAPFKAIEAMEKGLGYDIEPDLEIEGDLFADCVVSDVAKNLIGIFLNTRAAGRLPRIEGIEPAKIKKVAQLGSGVMGSGIVSVLLKSGYEVVLWEINEEAIQKGVAAIRKTYDYPIKIKKMTQADLDTMLDSQLTTTTSLADLKDVDLVIEAVLEDMKIKQDIWSQLEKICRPDVVFATNTSALPITEMASIFKDPGRMIGLHFFNPAHRMQLLEVICAEKTSDQTLATCVALARSMRIMSHGNSAAFSAALSFFRPTASMVPSLKKPCSISACPWVRPHWPISRVSTSIIMSERTLNKGWGSAIRFTPLSKWFIRPGAMAAKPAPGI
jgi:hypothetical protein